MDEKTEISYTERGTKITETGGFVGMSRDEQQAYFDRLLAAGDPWAVGANATLNRIFTNIARRKAERLAREAAEAAEQHTKSPDDIGA